MNLIEVLSGNGVPFEMKENDNAYVDCPKCGARKMSIELSTGIFHCWGLGCEEVKGGFNELVRIYSLNATGFTPGAAPPKVEKKLTQGERDAIARATSNKAEVVAWAISRKLDPKFVLSLGIGYDSSYSAICIPFRDPQTGEIVGARYKGTNGDVWCRGKEPKLYVLDPNDLKCEKIVLVEGEVDAITLKMLGCPVAATFGAGKTKGLSLLSAVRSVYLGYDMDEAGAIGLEKAAQELGRYRCKRVEWLAKDPNDMLKAGRTNEEILGCLKASKSLAESVRTLNAHDALGEYLSTLNQKQGRRLSWGYPRLDSFTHGIGSGMFIGVLAEAGTGKTTFIINAARNNAHAGINVGIASLEEHAVNEITPKIMSTIVGRNPGSGGFSQEELVYAKPVLNRIHLYKGDEQVDEVIEWIKECYYLHDCKLVFIDYLQLMISDEKDVQQVKSVCYRFKKLTKELSDLCIVMVIQPKQKMKSFDKQGKELKSNKLDGADARGGAAINQSVDAFLTIKAIEQHSNLTQYEYTKVRGHLRVSKRDWLGLFTQLQYDHGTMRQVEVSHMIYGN